MAHYLVAVMELHRCFITSRADKPYRASTLACPAYFVLATLEIALYLVIQFYYYTLLTISIPFPHRDSNP
jgi:hypothetical protein